MKIRTVNGYKHICSGVDCKICGFARTGIISIERFIQIDHNYGSSPPIEHHFPLMWTWGFKFNDLLDSLEKHLYHFHDPDDMGPPERPIIHRKTGRLRKMKGCECPICGQRRVIRDNRFVCLEEHP